MQQTVTVLRQMPNGAAVVRSVRQSACGGNCGECHGCGAAQEYVDIEAENRIHAREGDRVVLEISSGSVMAAVALVYVVPLVLFFLGLAVGCLLPGSMWIWGAVGFVLGILTAVFCDRRVRKNASFRYVISAFADRCEQ